MKNIGILQSMQMHRFRVMINDDSELACQVIKCSFNFVKKEFKVIVRQPITKDIIDSINDIRIATINVDACSPDNSKNFFSIQLSTCKLINHQFDLDYSSGDIAKHVLIFKYSDVNTK